MRPNDQGGKKQILTSHLGRKFYCAKKECLRERHPFFWKGLLCIKKQVQDTLSPGHFRVLNEQLHFSLDMVVTDC